MQFKNAPREEVERPTAEQFSYTRTQKGLKHWFGWLAGAPYWCRAHEHNKFQKGTKVCLQWITDKELHCPRCSAAKPATRVCYVPVFREEDNHPCLVIVHERAEDFLLDLVFGVRVLVGRVSDDASVFVKRAEQQYDMRTENPLRKAPCDLTESLLTIWGYPQLREWLERKKREARMRGPGAPQKKPAEQPKDKPARSGPKSRLEPPEPYDGTAASAIRCGKTIDYLLNSKFPQNGHSPSEKPEEGNGAAEST